MRGALLVALAALLASLPATAGEPSGELVFRLTNRLDAQSVQLVVEKGGSRVFDKTVEIAGGTVVEIPTGLAPGLYWAELRTSLRAGSQPILEGGVAENADSRGCAGPFRLGFTADQVNGGAFWFNEPWGCLAPPPGFETLVAEAQAATRLRERDLGSLVVGRARSADLGEFLEWSAFTPPEWENATSIRFRAATASAFDRWGREVEVDRIERFESDEGSASGASAIGGTRDEATAAGLARVLDFERGTGAFVGRTLGFSLRGSASLTGTSASAIEVYTYASPEAARECVLRHPLEGARIAPGAAFTGPCFSALTPWRVGEPAVFEGFRTVPAYALLEEGGRTTVTRVRFAEGIAYPLEVEIAASGGGEISTRTILKLTRLQVDGEALPLVGASSVDPAVELPPIDALAGPSPGRANDWPFPLEGASQAARSNPALARLQGLTANPDAGLVGAVFRQRTIAGAEAAVPTWALAFAAPGTPPVFVVCEQPVVDARRCAEADAVPLWASEISSPPDEIRLPHAGASFEMATSRWRAEGGNGIPSFATYRSWSAPQGAAPPAILAVGSMPAASEGPRARPADGESHIVSIELLTARSALSTRGASRASGVGAIPLLDSGAAVVSPRVPPMGPLTGAIPLLIGASLAVAIVLGHVFREALRGLAAGLYTRLAPGAILAQETRARIYEVVQAEPGIHARAISDRIEAAGGVTQYHLDVLVREGYLTEAESPGFRRYFVAGRLSSEEMRRLSALRNPHAARVHALIESEAGISLSRLAERAGLSMSHASKTVRKLVDAGLVEREAFGRSVIFRVARRPPAREP